VRKDPKKKAVRAKETLGELRSLSLKIRTGLHGGRAKRLAKEVFQRTAEL
jgi:hypothetical protein